VAEGETETGPDVDLLTVAKRQKQVLWMIFIQFVALFATIIMPYALFIASIVTIYFMYQLARALGSSVAWLYAILACIPLISLFTLIYLNNRATRTLRDNGIEVGLMGARSADLEDLDRAE